MEFKSSEEVAVDIEGGWASSSSSCSTSVCQCRICHEEEEESSTTMEIPCACSGSLKFAHRGCIQRWCDEKGGTLCEICLQNFEPGYTVAPKKALVDVGVTIRESLEVPRQHYGPPSSDEEETLIDYGAECSPASRRSASCCRKIAVTFTVVLLLRHLISVITLGADHYAFTLLTVFLLRASGILLPFFVIMRVLSAIQNLQRRPRSNTESETEDDGDDLEQQGVDQIQPHTVQIHS